MPSLPVFEQAARVRRGEQRSTDLVTEALKTIRKRDPEINAFISVTEEAALSRAAEIDQLPEKDRSPLALAGIPIAVKDNICTRGVKTTCASRMLESFIAPYDATVIEACRAAGAVIIGKTNLDEFAMGSSTETSYFSATRNPSDPTRVPGGSSGGSAAAVAADMTTIALGSDTGGSIRQPCSHCGVAGLKPTYGRVSRYGLVAFASSLDQIGPIARDVRDLGVLLTVLSRPDPRDSTNARRAFQYDPQTAGKTGGPLRVGIPNEYFGDGLSDDVRKVIDNTIAQLKEKQVEFVPVSLPMLSHAIATYYIICTAEASSNLARYDGVKYGHRSTTARSLSEMYTATREEGFGAEVKRRIMLGTYVLSSGYYDAYYLRAARVRTRITSDFDKVFSSCDALISPVAPTPAFRLGEKCNDPLQMYLTDIYTVSANLAGIPAISIPCGTCDGLPVGVQFMAPRFKEATLLDLGYRVQSSA